MNKPPSPAREISYHVPDHMIVLEFNGDSDAIDFEEWWQQKGQDQFARWQDSQ